jgi:SsrA-binding protein
MKIVAQNRRAKFDYDIVDTVEAGIVLTGAEVKSCRLGQVSLAGSYVSFVSGFPVLKQAKISPYAYVGNQPEYEPGRDRKLLLRKSELERLDSSQAEKGVAIIPLEVKAGRHIKVLLGLAKGRKTIDKRQRIKDREMGKRMRMGRE